MKASLKIVLGLSLGLTWGTGSYATEPTSAGQTGETQSSCGAKTDEKFKRLDEDSDSTPTKSEKRRNSSAASARSEHNSKEK